MEITDRDKITIQLENIANQYATDLVDHWKNGDIKGLKITICNMQRILRLAEDQTIKDLWDSV